MTSTRRKLTDLDLEVLRAAARNDGSVWRDDLTFDSYLAGPGMPRRCNRNVRKMLDFDDRLLTIGIRVRHRSPWLLTDAGRAALDDADKKVTR